jgi:hypothetical protein
MTDAALRDQLARVLSWHDAHVDFDSAVADLPVEARGRTAPGVPYSPWQLVEHMRLAQYDILDFCRNPKYRELEWPAAYWPSSPAPRSAADWDESVTAFRRDRGALEQLARDPRVDLFAKIPHGSGQTILREILLAADHAAYHVGQLVLVRRLLGVWRP